MRQPVDAFNVIARITQQVTVSVCIRAPRVLQSCIPSESLQATRGIDSIPRQAVSEPTRSVDSPVSKL